MFKRELYLSQIRDLIDTELIKVIVGMRRCGKTYLLKSIINELLKEGIKEKNIIYISFESAKYNKIFTSEDLDELIFDITKNIEGKIYLLFDEIQQVNSWEKSINSYRVDLNSDIYITGSNSKLLSNELATLLSGRYVKINLFPFSYKEIIEYKQKFQHLELNDKIKKEVFNEYLLYGGMPSLLNINNTTAKESVLSDIYDSIIIHDIISRYPIKEIDLFKRFCYYLMNSTSQPFSKTNITNYLKNENKKTTRNTISNFTNYMQEALFCRMVRRQDITGKKILKTEEKYYLTDQGFHHVLVDDNKRWLPRILENIIYNELIRRNYSVKIGKIGKKEIDFVCEKHNQKIYIQVSTYLSTQKTMDREFTPLLDVPDRYDAYVLSMDEEDKSQNGIKHLNIIDFLLSDDF